MPVEVQSYQCIEVIGVNIFIVDILYIIHFIIFHVYSYWLYSLMDFEIEDNEGSPVKSLYFQQ